MSILTPAVRIFEYTLQPIRLSSWLGVNVTSLDVLAAFRLCLVLRQLREINFKQHVTKYGGHTVENSSFVRSAFTTLTVVYGGETMTGPLLGVPPSYMLSGVFPGLFAVVQAIIDSLPAVPSPFLELELPFAVLDGFTRALLLCSLIPPIVIANSSKAIASSPWTLLLTSLVTANGGFFLANMLSCLHPTPLTLTTPAELLPYGWTATDLWCAPLVTGLYALLTHAQPFWAEAHTFITHLLGGAMDAKTAIEPVDPALARAACAVFLSFLFVGRTLKNSGVQWQWRKASSAIEKLKTQ